jgi:rhodanese-related sulfurtransferase
MGARAADDATSGHIQGAVSVRAGKEKAVLKSLPAPKLNAPIIVYDSRGGEQAAAVAKAFIQAGQQNVLVLNGGMVGWQAAGHAMESGVPAPTQIAYAPKPRAGSLPPAEFTTLAKATPANVLILDVRNPGEAAARRGCVGPRAQHPAGHPQAVDLPRDISTLPSHALRCRFRAPQSQGRGDSLAGRSHCRSLGRGHAKR